MMNQDLFQSKIDELYRLTDKSVMGKSATGISPESIPRFARALAGMKEWDLFRMNPLDFAQRHGMRIPETVGLFIYGAKAGLFSFEWNLLCPYCGGREHSHDSLNQLEKETYRCTVCDAAVMVEADEHLEVTFTIKGEISGFAPDPHRSHDDYNRYFFSPSFMRPQQLIDALSSQPALRFAALAPGQKARIKLAVTPVMKHRIITLDTHSIFTVYMDEKPCDSTQRISISHTSSGFDIKEMTILRGPAELEVSNASERPIGIIASSPDSAFLEATISEHPPYFKPFATGKMMLSYQNFRELFLVDDLPDDLSLKVNDISLMFTDLKGSTELYERTGDVRAYRLVQEHFLILQQIVQANRGAIVKTMGDAIMASFCTPADGIRAASTMLEEIRVFNRSIGEGEEAIGLKIGLHRGPVIAVKANQTLDYFGQTVNIAARVQGLAGSGEIWLSHDMLADESAAQAIKDMGYTLSPREVALKGVGGLVQVYQCCS